MSFSINNNDDSTNDPEVEKKEGFVDWKAEALKRLDMSEDELSEAIQAKKKEFDGLVSDDGAGAILVCKDHGIQLVDEVGVDIDSDMNIENVVPGLSDLRIRVTVKDVQDVNSFDGGQVRSVLVSDDSGRTQVSFWDEDADAAGNLSYGDDIMIKGAYTKEDVSDYMESRFDGTPAIQIGDSSTVEVDDDGEWIKIVE